MRVLVQGHSFQPIASSALLRRSRQRGARTEAVVRRPTRSGHRSISSMWIVPLMGRCGALRLHCLGRTRALQDGPPCPSTS